MTTISLIRSFALSLFLTTCSATPLPAEAVLVYAGPSGWIEMCEREDEPADFFCSPRDEEPFPAGIDPALEMQLANLGTNLLITPKTDREHYGVEEHWTEPDDLFGDCEDYALAKMRALRERGFPATSLRIVLGRSHIDGTVQNHAVLGVFLGNEVYLLDNLTSEILTPVSTELLITAVQQAGDPRKWSIVR